MERLLVDLRHAARQLMRVPAFTLSVVAILALGIGISAAIVSAADHVLFRPLALPHSERLFTICEVHQEDRSYCTVSPGNARDWARSSQTVEALGIARLRGIEIHQGERRVAEPAAMATPGFLEVLGVRPLHGRLLLEEDVPPQGSGSVAVLSYELWQEQYGGDPAVVGRVISVSSGGDGRVLHEEPVTVVGVLPRGIEVPRLGGARAWIPFQFDVAAEEHRGWRGFIALARLGPGVTLEAAAAELNAVEARLAEVHPADVANWRVELHALRAWVVKEVRPLLLLLLGAVGVVLAIACVNVVSLLIARATRRETELAVLAALGASRGRIAQQLVLEGLLLAGLGGAAGVLVASWLVQALVLLAPPGVPRIEEITVDGRVIGLTMIVAMVIGVVFGMVPALRLRHGHLQDVLRHGRAMTSDRKGQRVRRALVVSELALALTLLLSASLLMRSFNRLSAYDPGFPIERLLTFWVAPPMWRYETRELRREYYRRAQRELEALPGVVAVGTASAGPLIGGGDGRTPFLVRGAEPSQPQDAPTTAWFDAGPGWFRALGVPITTGRNLSPDAGEGEAVEALINETMARRYWPAGSPVGARLWLPDWEVEAEVVGVVADLQPFSRSLPAEPAIFVSNVQRPRGASFFALRTAGDPELLIPAVRRVLEQIDSEAQPRYLMSMEDLLRGELVSPRFTLLLIAMFALLALVLSTAGVYAVIAYTVALRTREFGIRLALGARSGQVLGSVLRDSGKLLAGGLALGALGAFYFTRLLRGVIHDVAPTDLPAVAITTAILAVAALAAAAGPAVRAARTEPATVLRGE